MSEVKTPAGMSAAKMTMPNKTHSGVSPNPLHGPLIIRRVVDAPPVVRHSQSDVEANPSQEEVTKKLAELKDQNKLSIRDLTTEDSRQPTPESAAPAQ